MSDGGRKTRGDGLVGEIFSEFIGWQRALCLFAFPASTREGANHVSLPVYLLKQIASVRNRDTAIVVCLSQARVSGGSLRLRYQDFFSHCPVRLKSRGLRASIVRLSKLDSPTVNNC